MEIKMSGPVHGNTVDLHGLPPVLARIAEVMMRRVELDGFDALTNAEVIAREAGTAQEREAGGAQRGLPGIRGAASAAVNIIPPPPGLPGQCAPVVLVIARKPSAVQPSNSHALIPPIHLASALRLLRQNLIECGSGPQGLGNRAVLILSDHWDRRRAYESRMDVDTHSRIAGLRYAALHWDGKRWCREWL